MDPGILFTAPLAENVEVRLAILAFFEVGIAESFAFDAQDAAACLGQGLATGKGSFAGKSGGLAGCPIR